MSEQVSVEDLLQELIAVGREQLRWQQAATLGPVRDALVATLTSTEMRSVYEMCDGEHTFREIGAATGVSHTTVGNWTKRWREAALVHETPTGRMMQLVSLQAIGMPVEIADDAGSAARRR